jgi:hypothetical protein
MRIGIALVALIAGCSDCGESGVPRRDGGNGTGSDGSARFDGAGPGPCTGLACRRVDCTGRTPTTLMGTVYTPAGDLPLYNAIVYVPNAPVDAFPNELTCARCDSNLSGDPIVQTTTDIRGEFRLEGVPTGADVPLVIQVGRWRRQIVVPSVSECAVTTLDAGMTRLPRNKGEGDIPRIALTTGGADALECLLRKVGIDDAEFTTEAGDGRVHLYAGEGGTDSFDGALGGMSFTPAPAFWETLTNLTRYDVVLHSCEGTEDPDNKSVTARQAMQTYVNMGGRVFASHWHNYWVEFGPDPFPSVANFDHQDDLDDPFTALLDTSFPKGMALADWLVHVGGSMVRGEIVIHAGQHTVNSVNPPAAQRWIYSDTPASVQYLTFNTPVGVMPEMQCGRFVLSDIHVSSGDSSSSDEPFPTGCTSDGLSAQEKVLIFMLFDLSSCIEPDILL